MPPLSLRAEVATASADDESRTVELVWTTGAAVERYDWRTGTRYLETLSLDPAHVRLERLNGGASLLDSHSAWSVSDILGAVVPGSARLERKQGRATVRFSRREAVQPVWEDVRDGIVRFVSVGYRVHKFEETPPAKDNAMPVRKAVDWEPFEVSMVPIPADAGAHTREGRSDDLNPCSIVPATRSTPPRQEGAPPAEKATKETTMDDERSETLVEAPDIPDAPAAPAAPVEEPTERDAGAAAERERVQGILLACRSARLPQSFADRLIKEATPLVRAQSLVFEEINKRDPSDAPRQGGRPASDAIVGEDPLVHARGAIRDALLHRIAPQMKDPETQKQRFPLSEHARQYRGLSLLDTARVLLKARGMRVTSMDKSSILRAALGEGAVFVHDARRDTAMDLRGMHTTSDFALILADVQGKVLRAAYAEQPQTWMPIARRVTLTDFKPSKQLQFGEAPELLEVLEHGEFTRGTIGEAKEQFQLATYGRIFGITRQALINDDLDAFSRVASEFGRAARRKESDLAWAQITGNPAMGDGNTLFDASNHANYTASGTVISVASLGVGRKTLRIQKGVDGTTVLNLVPSFLIVPAALETVAQQYTSANFVSAQAGNVNPFAGRLQVITEPRLDAADADGWYLAASPDQIDILLHGVLEGQEGPAIETKVGFDIDGLEVKARLDTAFKVADWRGLYLNAGA